MQFSSTFVALVAAGLSTVVASPAPAPAEVTSDTIDVSNSTELGKRTIGGVSYFVPDRTEMHHPAVKQKT